jgi:hypothetical protein
MNKLPVSAVLPTLSAPPVDAADAYRYASVDCVTVALMPYLRHNHSTDHQFAAASLGPSRTSVSSMPAPRGRLR